MKTTVKAHLAVIGTNIFFAANFSLIKYISPSLIKPLAINLMRVGISFLLFWFVLLFAKSFTSSSIKADIQKKDFPRFLLCAITGVAINQIFFVKGIILTSPIHASLLMLMTPLLITIFAFWVLKEKLTLAKAAGISLGIGGSLLLILSKEQTTNSGDYLLGDLFIFINATSYSIYFILVKPLMLKYPPLHVIRWVFTLGFILVLPFGWGDLNHVDWPLFQWSHFASLTAIVFTGTFLAYFFNIYGIQHLGAGVTGSYIYTQPIFSAIIAVIFSHEKLTSEKNFSGILIFTGVFLVSSVKKSFNKGLGVIEE